MTQPDLNHLRNLLDEYEKFANAIKANPAKARMADSILAVIAEARASLHPSPDSTANFVEGKQVIERLAGLRAEAERSA